MTFDHILGLFDVTQYFKIVLPVITLVFYYNIVSLIIVMLLITIM